MTLRGEEIRRVRRLTGLTQQAFGALLGVSARSVRAWERGEHTPRYVEQVLAQLAELDSQGIPDRNDIRKINGGRWPMAQLEYDDEAEALAAHVAVALYRAHSSVAAMTGDAYTAITASWTDEDGKLHTVTFSTSEPDEDDD